MFSHPHVRSALLSSLAVFLLLVTFIGFPGASAGQATTLPGPAAAGPAAVPECAQTPTFNASNFPSSPNINNTWYPLVPGTQFILEGRANRTGETLDHKVIFTVTDLTKVINGVRTVVLWDQDINGGQLVEAELAFHAQDKSGNAWVLGEYPEEYTGGVPAAPSTWISGKNQALAGVLVPGAPKVSQTRFLEAYAPNDVIYDCGRVAALGPRTPALCVPVGCYDTNVLQIDEDSPPETAIQQKYYAPGVGNFKVGALNDPEGETLVLISKGQLNLADCLQARQAAKTLDASGRTISSLYAQSALLEPSEASKSCEATAPTPTPPAGAGQNIYMPLASKPLPTATPPPAIYDGCKSDPNPASATNSPVRIVSVNKLTEVVTLQNVSDKTVSLEDWNMCSLATNRDHDQIFGTIAPGQTRTFSNVGGSLVWNDSTRNDGALYNAAGFLVSYWLDQ